MVSGDTADAKTDGVHNTALELAATSLVRRALLPSRGLSGSRGLSRRRGLSVSRGRWRARCEASAQRVVRGDKGATLSRSSVYPNIAPSVVLIANIAAVHNAFIRLTWGEGGDFKQGRHAIISASGWVSVANARGSRWGRVGRCLGNSRGVGGRGVGRRRVGWRRIRWSASRNRRRRRNDGANT